jgi:hypothetical protein
VPTVDADGFGGDQRYDDVASTTLRLV